MADIRCSVDDIDRVLEEMILEPELKRNKQAMANGIDRTMREMVAETKKNSPVDDNNWGPGSEYAQGPPKRTPFPSKGRDGKFKKAITWKKEDYPLSHKATWYVRSPEYRLTHLLVHGHELFVFGKPMNRRTDGHPFVHDARDNAEANLEKNIREEGEKLR